MKNVYVLATLFALSVSAAHAQTALETSAGSASRSAAAAGAYSGGSQSAINIGSGSADRSGNGSAPVIGSTLDYKVNSTTYANPVDLGKAVPNMWAPGLGGGGSNPCVVSVSGAGVGSGFGISFGRSYNDEECQVRETLRTVGAQLNPKNPQAQILQRNIACQSEIVRKAMRESGMRCANDPAPRVARTTTSSSQTPVADSGGYADAVTKCRSVPDLRYSGCMRQARSLL